MKVSNYKANCIEIIKANLNNRKLVCYGDVDNELECYMKENGLDIAFKVLRNKSLCDSKTFFDAAVLESTVSQYYVICFTSSNSEKDTSWIREYGYQQGKDYMFMASVASVVPKGAVNWCDKNGNTCNYCPDNCRITFKGNNSEVYISTNIKIKNQMNIRLGDDCKVVIGEKVSIREGNWLLNGDCASISIADNVSINESNIIMYSHSNINIENSTSIFEVMIRTFQNTRISIGKDCMISQKVILYAGDGHSIFDVENAKRINNPYDDLESKGHRNIELGDHVWVGMSAIMLNGTVIGKGSIVGMGAVIKGLFPNNCSIVGNPARIIKKNIAWSRGIMDMDISACGDEYINMTLESGGDDN